MEPAVSIERLVKVYGPVRALDGIDITVEAGTVCALLGPNGAGKTTAVRVLSTLATPDEGRASVLGNDVVENAMQVRRSIGLAGQNAAVDDDLTGRENLVILGRMLHLGRTGAGDGPTSCSPGSIWPMPPTGWCGPGRAGCADGWT